MIKTMWRKLLAWLRTPADKSSKFDQPQEEPLFIAIRGDDPAMLAAYAQAAATLPQFIYHVERGGSHTSNAKLKFRDPDWSQQLGEHRFAYLWLTAIHYDPKERVFSGMFFEVPQEFMKWHKVGERLAFDGSDIFDWMVLENGHLYGGFTLRVARNGLAENERSSYDRFVGVSVYEPVENPHEGPAA